MAHEIMVYLLLLILAIAAYVWTKRIGTNRGNRRFNGSTPPWLSSITGFLQKANLPGSSVPRGQRFDIQTEETLAKALEAQVTTVLEELYQEFCEETKRVRMDAAVAVERLQAELLKEINALQAQVDSLKAQLESGGKSHDVLTQVVEDSQAVRPEPNSAWTGTTAFDPVYFQIYDELQAGKPQMEVAERLGVGVEVVRLVERVMSNAQLS